MWENRRIGCHTSSEGDACDIRIMIQVHLSDQTCHRIEEEVVDDRDAEVLPTELWECFESLVIEVNQLWHPIDVGVGGDLTDVDERVHDGEVSKKAINKQRDNSVFPVVCGTIRTVRGRVARDNVHNIVVEC